MMIFNRQKTNHRGFTLIETLVVILMLGVLAAIGIRQLFLLVNQQRVNVVRDSVVHYLKKAQAEAISEQEEFSATFRLSDRGPVVAIYPTDTPESEWMWEEVGTNLAEDRFFFGANFAEHTVTFNSLGITEDAGFTVLVAVISENEVLPRTVRCVSILNSNMQLDVGNYSACGIMANADSSDVSNESSEIDYVNIHNRNANIYDLQPLLNTFTVSPERMDLEPENGRENPRNQRDNVN